MRALAGIVTPATAELHDVVVAATSCFSSTMGASVTVGDESVDSDSDSDADADADADAEAEAGIWVEESSDEEASTCVLAAGRTEVGKLYGVFPDVLVLAAAPATYVLVLELVGSGTPHSVAGKLLGSWM